MRRTIASIALLALVACGGGQNIPPMSDQAPGGTTPGATVFDVSAAACAVSYDGFVWYTVPAGGFSPIDLRQAKCGTSTLSVAGTPARPSWAIPHGPTQTRFIATSLQGAFSLGGMESIEAQAAPKHVPVSWMLQSFAYLANPKLYQTYHANNGDDVEAESAPNLVARMKDDFPWYVPSVSAEGAGHERNIAGLIALGERAFWGITWNSHGTDQTYDYGAPWGSYCADVSSYKRPQPNGGCFLLAFEWTARDLTRAYLSGFEDYYSTDPDDLQQRAKFSVPNAQTYIRAIADAYAAAGETQPIVMMSQQESSEDLNPGDADILGALYAQAVADGMKVETLAQAATDARTFSAAPRAVAFPYIPGGLTLPSSIVNGQRVYPATIDYHDATAGMTFLAGHTLPTRMFAYAADPTSQWNVPLVSTPAAQFPSITGASVHKGVLSLQLSAPSAMHFGIAIWANPTTLGITQAGAIPAGRAGEVVIFDIQSGPNQVSIKCPGCHSTTFTYST
jgi:hypothetical protein